MKTLLLILICTCNVISINAQSSIWVTVQPAGQFFTFSLPDTPTTSIDIAEYSLYQYSIDSIDFVAGLSKLDSAFIYYLNLEAEEDSTWYESGDSLTNPLIALTEYFRYGFDSVEIIDIHDILTNDTSILGREVSVAYIQDAKPKRVISMQMFYNGHDILTLSIDAPFTKQELYLTLKEQFFASIIIN
jgi:hypothetical protein